MGVQSSWHSLTREIYMKTADKEKEQLFIEHYVMTNNASESCVLAGYKKENSAQMGYYLKNKLKNEIKTQQTETLTDLAGKSISVLENLLENGKENVQFNTAKLILELSGYNKQNINLNIESNKDSDKTDNEMFSELDELLKGFDPVNQLPKMMREFEKKKNNH